MPNAVMYDWTSQGDPSIASLAVGHLIQVVPYFVGEAIETEVEKCSHRRPTAEDLVHHFTR